MASTSAAYQNATFCFAPRGDTPTSRRLSDGMAYGAIPIFISDELAQHGVPFPCYVPYELFSLWLPERQLLAASNPSPSASRTACGFMVAVSPATPGMPPQN